MIRVSIDQLFSSWIIVKTSSVFPFLSFFFLIDHSCVFGLNVFLTIGYVLPNVDACIFLKESHCHSRWPMVWSVLLQFYCTRGVNRSVKLRLNALSEPFSQTKWRLQLVSVILPRYINILSWIISCLCPRFTVAGRDWRQRLLSLETRRWRTR